MNHMATVYYLYSVNSSFDLLFYLMNLILWFFWFSFSPLLKHIIINIINIIFCFYNIAETWNIRKNGNATFLSCLSSVGKCLFTTFFVLIFRFKTYFDTSIFFILNYKMFYLVSNFFLYKKSILIPIDLTKTWVHLRHLISDM